MPEINQSDNLRGEIKMLEKMIAKKKAALGRDHTAPEAREAIKETLHEMYPVQIPPPQETPTIENSGPAPTSATTGATLPSDYLDSLSEDLRMELDQLIAIAFTKSIREATETATISAQNTNDFFMVDALHDALATRLYDELKAAGKI